MTTREQDAAIDRLALEHGSVAVRHGYVGGFVYAAVPYGPCWRITADGVARHAGSDNSIDWSDHE